MKNNYLLKIFYLFVIFTGIQFAYSDSLSFDFLYSNNIQSISFVYTEYDDYATDIDQYSKFSVNTSDLGDKYRVTVNADITHQGSSGIAEEFNWISYYLPDYDKSHFMELAGPESGAAYMDFWVLGDLYINGKLVDDRFTLAHNNHSNNIAANDWWITSDSASRYESGNLVRLNVQDVDGKHYCLNQNNNNYQVIVTTGVCNSDMVSPDDWGKTKQKKFHFEYESGVESVVFVYDGVHDDQHHNQDYLAGVTSNPYKYGYEVTVASKIDADSGTATSFNDKFNSNSNAQLYELEMSKSTKSLSTPNKLNFWVEGHLYINGSLVASDFTLGEDGNWWTGTNSGNSFVDTDGDGLVKMHLDGYCLSGRSSDTVMVSLGACPEVVYPSGGAHPV